MDKELLYAIAAGERIEVCEQGGGRWVEVSKEHLFHWLARQCPPNYWRLKPKTISFAGGEFSMPVAAREVDEAWISFSVSARTKLVHFPDKESADKLFLLLSTVFGGAQ